MGDGFGGEVAIREFSDYAWEDAYILRQLI